LMEF